MDLDDYRRSLVRAAAADSGITSLVFFGSAARSGAARRDEWSDLDFNIFFTPEADRRHRDAWPFLPEPERIVLRAREGADGGVVIYDDGVLLEFGAGQPWPISDPERDTALDGGDLILAPPPQPPRPDNAVRLFLAKLFIGVGRYRRGEHIAAHAHVRAHALAQLCWVLRLRLAPDRPGSPYDPTRRFERALPDLAGEIGSLLDGDLEVCARGLFDVARRELEPGWHEFPSAAADTIARRLGWGFSPARFDGVLRHHSCDDAPDGCQGSGDGSVTTRARP